MRPLTMSAESAIANTIIIEVIRISKLSNPKSIIGVTNEDIDYLVKNIADEYLMDNIYLGKKLLDEAVRQFFVLSQTNSNINLGDFSRLCHTIKQQQKELAKSQSLIAPVRHTTTNESKKNVNEIKQGLAKVINPLPYNKNIRIAEENEKNAKNAIAQVKTGFYGNDDLPDGECYSDGPKLYQKCVNAGHIAPIESIKNPRLKELYAKAWNQGLMLEEKEEFEGLRNIEEKTPAKRASK